jgi:hypothetical protein
MPLHAAKSILGDLDCHKPAFTRGVERLLVLVGEREPPNDWLPFSAPAKKTQGLIHVTCIVNMPRPVVVHVVIPVL